MAEIISEAVVGIEISGTVAANAAVPIEALAAVATNATMPVEIPALRWMPISAETRVVALVIGALGLCLWWTRFSGLGDNLLVVTSVVFVVDGIDRLRKLLHRWPWGRRLLERVGLNPKVVV